MSAAAGGEFRTGWRVLLGAALGAGSGHPTLAYYTIGFFAPTLADNFGWSFAQIFGGLTLTTVLLVLVGPWVGHLVDRHGPRKIAGVSIACLGLSYMTLALSNGSLLRYYASWAAISTCGLGATLISFSRAANGVFVERRGLALGIIATGAGLFAAAVKPFAAWLSAIGGWRVAMVIIGLVPILIGLPAVMWGLRRGASSEQTGARQDLLPPGRSVAQAVRSRSLWVMVLVFVPVSFASGAPIPNMENILRAAGIAGPDVVTLASLLGIALILGRLVGGWVIDRIWAPLVGAAILIGAALACWTLAQPGLDYGRALLAVVLLGFAAGVETDLLSYLVARYFGMRSYGAIYGILYGTFAIGAGIGPSLLGYAYDQARSYQGVMGVCSLLLMAAAGLLLGLGPYPDPEWIPKADPTCS